tara:strand:- start:304 stop:636 length:333 start_codon:yes stop_codon:yes gene_type:complete
MSIVQRFSKLLSNVEYPDVIKSWNIAGTLSNSNEHLKFDVRDMFKLNNGDLGKKVKLTERVDKIVFETKNKWLILDQKEFNIYLKKQKQNVVYLDNLIKNLDWTKIILKE